ncbi:heparan-alpha-glucosaminide N-acetyltransferase domain-containing protein [Pelomonas sp. SE-A7]|uniref:acyltransferase family protein n=1 Tax=Pelomonas sp. SE-A7 TaxID=3054953 RepID=UPI00259C901D|nr:heparan-alpha-glucosaminide N-acetyltransferase domain-containing protein [Pelomonas sp. SE-A7]MDM4766824.1 heparan-alpha-glucosaminide N-acetyltransferase domain-containing protein [Pelomonas sp. SE-A7]
MTAARLQSVDALRGLTVAAMLLVNNPGDWGHVYAPLEHAAWHGCTPTDLIFPFFLFIVGVSCALSLGARVEAGAEPDPLRKSVLVRSLRIIGLGLVLHLLAWWLMNRPEFRLMGVLQRIGLCFAFVGLVAIQLRERSQCLLLAGLLVGYGALLHGGATLEKSGSLAQRIDTAVLGRFAYEWDAASGIAFDPEGLLSTLGALGTCVLGLLCGAQLRSGRVAALVVTGIAAAALGLVWSELLPFNKQLWTPSFVLWTGGLAALALAGAHWLVDQHRAPALGQAFGINAIAVYAGAWMATVLLEGLGWMPKLYATGFGWLQAWIGPYGQSLAFALCFVLAFGLLARWMKRRGLVIKV